MTAYEVILGNYHPDQLQSFYENMSTKQLEQARAKADIIVAGLNKLRDETGLYKPGFLGPKNFTITHAEQDTTSGYESVWIYTNVTLPGEGCRLHIGCRPDGITLCHAGRSSVENTDEQSALAAIRKEAEAAGWKARNPEVQPQPDVPASAVAAPAAFAPSP